MTTSSRHAVAGLCGVARQFSQCSELAQLNRSIDAATQNAVDIARCLSAGVVATSSLAAASATIDTPLPSIFSSVNSDGRPGTPDLFWPGRALAVTPESLFPVSRAELADASTALADLRRAFDRQVAPLLERLNDAPGDLSALESLLLLMQRYLAAVPTLDAPATSLYDHAHMTAALAATLTSLDTREIERLARADLTHDGTPVALLVGGDLSGIQAFIYTITSRGAASALRGRSFYLQLLTEAVLRNTLRELDLPITSMVYAGGGKFYLLARPGDQASISAIQRHISTVLLRHHQGDLTLSLQAVPLATSDFFGGRVSAKWQAIADLHQHAKQRRFAELGAAAFNLFEPQGAGGTLDQQCQVCGNEHPRTVLDRSTRKCPQCHSYEDLGDALRNARFLALGEVAPAQAGRLGGYADVLREFGLVAKPRETAADATAVEGNPRVVFALDDAGLRELEPGAGLAVGRRFIANVVPRLSEGDIDKLVAAGVDLPDEPLGKVKSFDGMAEQARGIKRLGVLRMDVDNAGQLFSTGLGERASLARIAHLSFALNLFFEGWVAHLAASINRRGREERPQEGERLYAVYCGGDDVFFVGAWDAVVELVSKIDHDLADYTRHAGVHASAGLVLVNGKYPLFRSAQDADEAEGRAKQGGKNAIVFLGERLSWDDFAATRQRAELFANWCGRAGPLSRSFLQALQELHTEHERALAAAAAAGKKPKYTRATWMAAYKLTRVLDDKRVRGSPVASEVEQIREVLSTPNANTLPLVLAARWAQFILRDNSKDGNERASREDA